MNADVLAAGDQVLLRVGIVGANDQPPHALDEAAHLDATVDLGDDRLLLRLAGLEQLGHARQSSGDVLRLRGLPRDLGDDVGGEHVGALRYQQVRPHRERVAVAAIPPAGLCRRRGAVAADDHARLQPALDVLDDDLPREAGHLVELLPDRDVLDDVVVLDAPGELGEDRVRERIPLDQDPARLHPLVRLHLDPGAVDDGVALALPAALVGDADLPVAVGRDEVAVAVHDGAQVVVLHDAGVLRLVLRGLDHPARGAADVEGPHRELRARLADRLGRDDADGLAELGQPPGPEIAPVAHDADAPLRLAGERRPDAHALEPRLLDLLGQLLGDLGVGLDDDLARQRIPNVLRRHAAEHAVAQGLDDVAPFDERRRVDALHGPAVVLGDDHVLRHVDQPAREVARVRRLERGVGQPLSRAVGRGEVLEHGEALAEVGGDRGLDDLARGLGHEAAHAGELPDLLLAAPGARVGHHVDRIELPALLTPLELFEHLVGDDLGDVRPDVDDLVVALAVRDHAVLVLLLDLVDVLARLGDELFLGRRDVHVVDADRQPGERRIPEPDVLQLVEEGDGRLVPELVVAAADQRGDLLLLQLLVHEPERLRHHFVQERAADGGLDDLATVAQPDPRLQIHVLVVVGDPDLLGVGKQPLLPAHRPLRRREPLLGEVVEAEDHVLRRHGQRRAVRRREDVVGRQHQHLRLELRLHRQGNVHRHLVAVEVRVEGGADERMDLDRLALDQDRLEGLDAQPVERGGPVEQHRVLLDDLFEDVPDLGPLLLHELLGGLDRGRDPALLQLAQDEGLEQLEGHLLRQPALVQLQVGADHDDRPPRIVHALAEQVLAEPPLLALQRVRERLQRPVVRARDDAAAAPVVEQGVHRLLEHPLFVADDDLRRLQLHQALEAVVPIDDPPIQVIEVRGREAPPIQRDERAQLGRDHRDDLEDHPLRLVPGLEEGLDDLQALDDLLALLHRGLHEHLRAELPGEPVQLHAPEQLADRLGAHADLEGVGPVLVAELAGLVDREQVLPLEAGNPSGLDDHVFLEIEDLLELPE